MHPLNPAWEVVQKEFDFRCSESARTAQRELSNDLNYLLRRFQQYRNEEEWIAAILDGAAHFVPQVAIFEVVSPASGSPENNGSHALRLRGQKGLDLPEAFAFSAGDAAAFQSAISSCDPAVALRTAAEVTDILAQTGANEKPVRCHVVPIANGTRVAAVIFASGNDVDAPVLELIAGMASMALERSTNRDLHLQLTPASREMKAESVTAPARMRHALPAWADLPDHDRARHLQAQRFARVTVAELQLFYPDACRSGRDDSNLYLYLKKHLDKARDHFRKTFTEIPTMVDYLHMELVHTAASGDESKLGAEYPGPLV